MALSPRRPKGPHLNALRAFEAAARLGSFTAAAEELSVTPGAVTQHIKALEAWAETRLFVRNARGVELTPLAEGLVPGFVKAFDELGMAVHALRSQATPSKIKIAALPAIAQLWLTPRLGKLRDVAPDISVSVIAMEMPPNLAREPFDMTLFFADEARGAGEMEIATDRIYPVCTPTIAARLNTVADLANETLLFDSTWTSDWDLWLDSQPHGDIVPRLGNVHSLYSIAVEEARNGAGVLMAHELLVGACLATGELVRPFSGSVELPRKLIATMTPAFSRSVVFGQIKPVLLGTPAIP